MLDQEWWDWLIITNKKEVVTSFNWIGLFVLIGGYLLGSCLPADWVARLKTGHSMQELNENPGAAGAYRKAGFWAAALVTFFDIGKGMLPIALADRFGLSGPWLVASACAPVIGHNWPIYKGFRDGGRGMATAMGGALWLGWPSILPGLGVGAVLVLWKRWAPWIGVVGLPLGFVGMALAGVEASRLWAVVALLFLMLLRQIPWISDQLKNHQNMGKFLPPNKSW